MAVTEQEEINEHDYNQSDCLPKGVVTTAFVYPGHVWDWWTLKLGANVGWPLPLQCLYLIRFRNDFTPF